MFDNDRKKNLVSASKIDSQPIATVIGHDVLLKGDLKGESVIRIDGKIEGNISLVKGIVLGEKAVITGNTQSDSVIIYGTVIGDITCKELIIKKTGTITGNISTTIIEIEMGGKYNGMLNMPKTSADIPLLQEGKKEKRKGEN